MLKTFWKLLMLRSPDDGKGGGGGVAGSGKDYPPASHVDEDEDDDTPSDYVEDDDEDEDSDVEDDDVDDDDSDEDDESSDDDKGNNEEGKDSDGSDGEADKGGDKGTKGGKKSPQSSEENHAQKLARLEREKKEAEQRAAQEKEEAVRKAKEEAFIEALGGVNPFTGEEIKNEDDLEEVRVMQKIKKRGGDPIADFAKYSKIFKQEEREANLQKAAQEEQRRKDTQKEIADFHKDYPDTDLQVLLNDPTFRENTKDIIGKVPLSVAMKIHLEREEMKKIKAQNEQDESDARRGSSSGSLGTNDGEGDDSFYTKEQLKKMTPEEINRNWPKVQRSYAKINSGK